MTRYRLDGLNRKKVTLLITKEAIRLFEDSSKQSMSEYLEEMILENFDNPNKLKEKELELQNELKLVRHKIRSSEIDKKHREEKVKLQNKNICALCGMESKKLILLKKQKAKICKNCFKTNTTKDITNLLKDGQR